MDKETVNNPLDSLMSPSWPNAQNTEVLPGSDGIGASATATAAASTTQSHPSLASLIGGSSSKINKGIKHDVNVVVNSTTRTSSHPSIASLTISNPTQHQQPKVKYVASLTSQNLSMMPTSPDAVHCVACSFEGSDLRIKGPCKCAYHARCLDLFGLANASNSSRSNGNIVIRTCPNCNGTSEGIEMLPLSFLELDRGQRLSSMGTKKAAAAVQDVLTNSAQQQPGMSRKRSSEDLLASGDNRNGGAAYPTNVSLACRASNDTLSSVTDPISHQSTNTVSPSTSKCYDPTVPRTGRWTEEELLFRDAIIAHFLHGDLPLSNGLKLNDFLSNMLKSKQSRLTKKMKHAKLSSKYFRIKNGCLTPESKAREFSLLEYNFINVIADPVERSEIQFHMAREWREHFAERCAYLRVQFDADEWLRSVDTMERRVALEKNRSRMVKRRCMMGQALAKDVNDNVPGVFINQVS